MVGFAFYSKDTGSVSLPSKPRARYRFFFRVFFLPCFSSFRPRSRFIRAFFLICWTSCRVFPIRSLCLYRLAPGSRERFRL